MEVEEQCIEETDEGELLVLRRALSDQEAPNHGVQEEEEVVCADEGDVLELKQLLNIQKCTFSSYVETHTAWSPREPMKNESFTPNMMGLRPHLNDRHPLNLRTNSFLEGENDVSMGGLLDQNKSVPSKQKSKPKNWLFKAPRAVGKAVAAPGLLSVFDRGKGQF